MLATADSGSVSRRRYPTAIVNVSLAIARWPAALVAVMTRVYRPGLSLFRFDSRPWKRTLWLLGSTVNDSTPRVRVRVHRGLLRFLTVGATQRPLTLRPGSRWVNANR